MPEVECNFSKIIDLFIDKIKFYLYLNPMNGLFTFSYGQFNKDLLKLKKNNPELTDEQIEFFKTFIQYNIGDYIYYSVDLYKYVIEKNKRWMLTDVLDAYRKENNINYPEIESYEL